MNPAVSAIKASLFNFIVYIPTKERSQYFYDIIQTVLERFPCRIILIENDPGYSKNVAVQSTTTTTSQGESSIICDRIRIQAGGKNLAVVPFLILPQLLPDLPIYLFWGEDPSLEKIILPQLSDYASRLIFDSDGITNLQDFCPKILAVSKEFSCDIVDTNWARFAGWRRILTQLFDTEGEIETLRNSKEINIIYNGPQTSSFNPLMLQALYFQAWLATQLEWKFLGKTKKENSIQFNYSYQDKKITVNFKGEPTNKFTPAALLSVEINSYDSHHFACKRLELSPLKVRVEMSSMECCRIPLNLPLTSRNSGFSFVREILYSPTSDHYLKMLQTLKSEW